MSGKKGTNSILGITLTKFNTFSQFLAQFILTFKVTEKNYKSVIITCTTLRIDDVSSTSSKCRFHEKINAKVHFAATVASKFTRFKSGGLQCVECSLLQEKVYKTRITDLDDLKHHIRTEWAKLDQAVIAAAVRQWRRRLSACVRAGGGHFEHCF